MVTPISFDPKMAAESAQEMGSILQNSFSKNVGLVNDMLSMKAESLQQPAASPEGMGESIDAYA